jgi:hypothetical protein
MLFVHNVIFANFGVPILIYFKLNNKYIIVLVKLIFILMLIVLGKNCQFFFYKYNARIGMYIFTIQSYRSLTCND